MGLLPYLEFTCCSQLDRICIYDDCRIPVLDHQNLQISEIEIIKLEDTGRNRNISHCIGAYNHSVTIVGMIFRITDVNFDSMSVKKHLE